MSLFTAITGFVGGLIKPATEIVKGWQARKEAKLKSDLAINEAKTNAVIKKIETQQQADIAWENTQINQSGWKDEYWTIVLSIPAIFCFIPFLTPYVAAGFAALATCPAWYQWMLAIAVGAAFGYRKIADFMSLKKGA